MKYRRRDWIEKARTCHDAEYEILYSGKHVGWIYVSRARRGGPTFTAWQARLDGHQHQPVRGTLRELKQLVNQMLGVW